jgi:hypothetical protein
MMPRSLNRASAALAAAGLMAAATLTGVVLGASPAMAYCNGIGHPTPISFSHNGAVRVRETAKSTTCDGDNQYRGTLTDAIGDGHSVSVMFQDGNFGYRTAASTGSSTDYIYNDVNNTSNANMKLCYGGICGWGSTRDGHGQNHGY